VNVELLITGLSCTCSRWASTGQQAMEGSNGAMILMEAQTIER